MKKHLAMIICGMLLYPQLTFTENPKNQTKNEHTEDNITKKKIRQAIDRKIKPKPKIYPLVWTTMGTNIRDELTTKNALTIIACSFLLNTVFGFTCNYTISNSAIERHLNHGYSYLAPAILFNPLFLCYESLFQKIERQLRKYHYINKIISADFWDYILVERALLSMIATLATLVISCNAGQRIGNATKDAIANFRTKQQL
ncbi:hypothetical protein IPH25_00810 [bacterium]|nr:MAG: hypothetical protein IPG37_02930 [bacterium]QQR61968.1 MAG: hypothetical protein IPH25_00810 [bacterium]QQR62439.1 MAG: hypothetical protein IPH67_03350 [bacterium]